MRRAAGLVLLLPFLAGLGSAQQPTTAIDVTLTPMGAWDADGYLDASNEGATWHVNATLTFSNTAVCPHDTTAHFDVVEAGPQAIGSVAPAQVAVEVPPGGGEAYAEADATLSVNAAALALEPQTLQLHVRVAACPSPVGTQPAAETNVTVDAQPLFKPGLRVAYDANFSYEGSFNFTLTNTGNGPLRITMTVSPVTGTANQDATFPATIQLVRGAEELAPLRFPAARPGFYNVRFEGVYGGQAPPGSLPTVTFEAQVEVRAKLVVKEEDSPGFEAAAVLVSVLAWVALKRRNTANR